MSYLIFSQLSGSCSSPRISVNIMFHCLLFLLKHWVQLIRTVLSSHFCFCCCVYVHFNLISMPARIRVPFCTFFRFVFVHYSIHSYICTIFQKKLLLRLVVSLFFFFFSPFCWSQRMKKSIKCILLAWCKYTNNEQLCRHIQNAYSNDWCLLIKISLNKSSEVNLKDLRFIPLDLFVARSLHIARYFSVSLLVSFISIWASIGFTIISFVVFVIISLWFEMSVWILLFPLPHFNLWIIFEMHTEAPEAPKAKWMKTK